VNDGDSVITSKAGTGTLTVPASWLRTPRQPSKCRRLRTCASQPVAEQILRTELRRLATDISA
jgi:hypothetical protein